MKLNKELNKFYAFTELGLMILGVICVPLIWIVPVSISYYFCGAGLIFCVAAYIMAQIRLKKGLELFDFDDV